MRKHSARRQMRVAEFPQRGLKGLLQFADVLVGVRQEVGQGERSGPTR